MRYRCILFFLVICNSLWSQDKHLLYNQTHNPQSLMLNPGAAYEKTDFHVGVPLLSNIYASVGNTALSVDNLFNANDFNTSVVAAIDRISSDDFAALNQKIDLISVGWRQEQRYYTAGVYQESDAVTNLPKDLIDLAYFGNAGQNRSYDIGQINFRANLQTVFHFGINEQVDENLHLGARVKLYTSDVNIRSVRNTGRFITRESETGLLLEQSISNLDLAFDSAGLENNDEFAPGDVLVGSNLGLGIDLGLSYYFNERLEFTASLLDLGFIQFKKDTKRVTVRGYYEYEGLGIQFPNFAQGDDLITYYQNLGDEIEENLPNETTSEAYLYIQPAKLNLGLSYNFGEEARLCECGLRSAGKPSGNQTLSLHSFTMASAGNLFYSLNVMYQRSFWNAFYVKVSLGIDQFNKPNYGGGVALDVWKVNLFLNVDRLNSFNNIYNAEALAYQFGMNLKF
ncbi:DUF5723 family protein [Psychroflexus sediminis]|uniref:DUF5723 domain-containing protein n=1 Tax=Psychroflexus sediminis TaxID=470826 RepID=A0A1G7UGS1_9FLAO|nr:DUF5723 family protein [Psychroflexus sediminis]SDG46756.1 hypothetical protein SAMN04488027_10270 [Psychroflexus sediminis]